MHVVLKFNINLRIDPHDLPCIFYLSSKWNIKLDMILALSLFL